jgi:nicotinate dehydrogenase subunit A
MTHPMLTLTLNGASRTIQSSPDTPLLYVLRNECGLNAAKYGCGLGQCGACTVIIDGEAVFSCITPVMLAENRKVTTLEGLGTADHPGKLQEAFIEEQAAQCGSGAKRGGGGYSAANCPAMKLAWHVEH